MIQHDDKFLSESNGDLTSVDNTLTDVDGETGKNPDPVDEAAYERERRELSRFETMIGEDDRQRVLENYYPYKCICLLEIENEYGHTFQGTGFLISARCIITAGHNVKNQGRWAKKIIVSPGASGAGRPFGSVEAKVFRSVQGWTVSQDPNFDYGAIILPDESLYAKVNSYLGYNIIGQKRTIEMSGYPNDKGTTQWKSEGGVKSFTPYRIKYELDTVKGNSGSPVFIKDNDTTIAVGVHTYGGSNENMSIRLNQSIMDRWKEWTML